MATGFEIRSCGGQEEGLEIHDSVAKGKEAGSNPENGMRNIRMAIALLFLASFWGLCGYEVYHFTHEARLKGLIEGAGYGKEVAKLEDRSLLRRAAEKCSQISICSEHDCDSAELYCLSKYNP